MSSTNKDAGAVPASPRRRAKKLLAPSVKYETFLQLVRGEATVNAAAESAGVDRSPIMKLSGCQERRAGGLGGVETGGREDPAGCRT